jgi:hypothetical protein
MRGWRGGGRIRWEGEVALEGRGEVRDRGELLCLMSLLAVLEEDEGK